MEYLKKKNEERNVSAVTVVVGVTFDTMSINAIVNICNM